MAYNETPTKGIVMIKNIADKLKSTDNTDELAETQKQIEDAIGAEAFAEFMDRRRKAKIRNTAIAIGTSVAVLGVAIWAVSKSSPVEDESSDDNETETTED